MVTKITFFPRVFWLNLFPKSILAQPFPKVDDNKIERKINSPYN
jgi:hypothetical protein